MHSSYDKIEPNRTEPNRIVHTRYDFILYKSHNFINTKILFSQDILLDCKVIENLSKWVLEN